MKMISLFAGPGGLCYAAECEGVPSVGIEWDANACATRRAAGLTTVEGDVRSYGPADFPDCNVLAGGPPCQTFSMTGNGAGRRALREVLHIAARMAQRKGVSFMLADLTDERTALVLEPLRWALEAHHLGRPYRAIILEQVPTVLPVWDFFATVLRGLGYNVEVGILRAEQYGVAQTRKRAVLIASLDHAVELPKPEFLPFRHGAVNDCRTMADVLPERGEFEVISNYGSGGDAANRGRRHSDEPAFTVTGKISRNRLVTSGGVELPRLSHAEAGVLQSFPEAWPWQGKDIPQQIGNAAPPLLMRPLVRAAVFGD